MQKYSSTIQDVEAPIEERVDSLFCLKAFEEIEAVDALIKAFEIEQKSELLNHEIFFVLG